jgi:hypothetical protein
LTFLIPLRTTRHASDGLLGYLPARTGTCGTVGIGGRPIPFSTPGFGIGAVGSGDIGAVVPGGGIIGCGGGAGAGVTIG